MSKIYVICDEKNQVFHNQNGKIYTFSEKTTYNIDKTMTGLRCSGVDVTKLQVKEFVLADILKTQVKYFLADFNEKMEELQENI